MVSIPDLLNPQVKKKRVLQRQFQILKCTHFVGWNEYSDYRYPIQLELRLHWQGANSKVHYVGFTVRQLWDYRLFQQAVFEQTSAVIVDDEEFELGDVGLWPLRLAGILGEVA